MKIGLMGGTFDPIHNMHIALAKSAAAECGLDRVIFMTAGNTPHKSGVTDAAARYEMTRLAVEDIPEFSASDYEVNLTGYSYSVNTLKYLKGKYPDDEICFIIGEDSLSYIENWYRPEEIARLCTLLVYPRTSEKTLLTLADRVRERLGAKIVCINAPVLDISSTEIRERLKAGGDVSDMVDKKVLKYINENNLYKR
ncbi:MAG: nicotinate-nucleotide adenylyltransferase [Firmicutes bacterium]|nr:nicotinate-nucleotide adenylyltransferase [Bacillota bacterium]